MSYTEVFWNLALNVGSTVGDCFMPLRKVWLHCVDFHRAHKQWINFCGRMLYPVFCMLDRNVEMWAKFDFPPAVKCGLLCISFNETQKLLNSIICSSPVLHFTHIGQEVWELWIEIDCHWACVYKSHACLTTFCKELLYQVSWKSGKLFSCCY